MVHRLHLQSGKGSIGIIGPGARLLPSKYPKAPQHHQHRRDRQAPVRDVSRIAPPARVVCRRGQVAGFGVRLHHRPTSSCLAANTMRNAPWRSSSLGRSLAYLCDETRATRPGCALLHGNSTRPQRALLSNYAHDFPSRSRKSRAFPPLFLGRGIPKVIGVKFRS